MRKVKLLKSKKGDLMTDFLMILLLMVLFFLLASPLDSIVNEVSVFTSDSNVTWMLRGFTFMVLIGIIKYVFSLGRGVGE